MQVQDERFIAIAEAMLLRFASLSPVQRYASYLAANICLSGFTMHIRNNYSILTGYGMECYRLQEQNAAHLLWRTLFVLLRKSDRSVKLKQKWPKAMAMLCADVRWLLGYLGLF
jgi:hypothetical protein